MTPFTVDLDEHGRGSVIVAGVDIAEQITALSLDVAHGDASVLTLALCQPGKLRGVADIHVTYEPPSDDAADAVRNLPGALVRARAEDLMRATHVPYVDALLATVADMLTETAVE